MDRAIAFIYLLIRDRQTPVLGCKNQVANGDMAIPLEQNGANQV